MKFLLTRFSNGEKRISLSFSTKAKSKTPEIRTDSVYFILSDGKRVSINDHIQDTIYFLHNGGLSYTMIHRIDEKQLIILKNAPIHTIVLIVDDRKLALDIQKRSQTDIMRILNSY
ncbi:MAG: hypothetical protein EOP04_07930 [Proteobacteria bacterium]|nr:MAG: hypothetical protein EOP04_07930 [Pseudomonadota bacterium]